MNPSRKLCDFDKFRPPLPFGKAPSAPIFAAGKKKNPLNPAEDFLLGGIVAVCSKTIAAPIERIKLLLQNQGESAAIKGNEYKGIMDVLKRVPAEQGVGAFWRGNVANCIRYFPTQALNLMCKERYKDLFNQYDHRTATFFRKLAGNVASGGMAGFTSLIFVYPLDFARTRLAMDVGSGGKREFNGTFDCIMKTAKTSGMFNKGGVYNGFWISAVGIFFYRGAYFGLYDTFAKGTMMSSGGFWAKFALGYAVTTVAGLISYPIDTIRRRMMMTSGANAGKYSGSFHCAGVIMQEEGIPAFFKGAGSNILRGLCGALVLVGFDEVKTAYINYRFPELNKNKST
eukprot:g615.t1